MNVFVSFLYALTLGGLMFFAVHRLKMVWLYLRHSRRKPAPGPFAPGAEPKVCIQCPLYNEALVVEELLEKVAAIRWPADRLEIQILDDSNDETSAIISRWLAARPALAARIHHIRRPERKGYKAGALAYGMTRTDAAFFAIFDADFRPEPDFLETLMPHFTDPKIGVVQARWEFSNRNSSLLTRFQGIFLDAHFVVEQEARHASGHFFNFNGTAGVWRRAALDEAGGWTDDTVTEDLDVSYRAQLCGWRFVYLPHYAVPSELPESATAFKSQQRRWTKGSMQVMRKQIGAILRSDHPLRIKTEATCHLFVGLVHPLLVLFSMIFVPFLILRDGQAQTGFWLWFNPLTVLLLSGGTAVFFITAQYFRRRQWHEAVLWFVTSPLMLALGLAMSITCCLAVIEGLTQWGGEFVRTPKGGRSVDLGGVVNRLSTRSLFVAITAVEVLFGAVMIYGSVHFGLLDRDSLALTLAIKAAGFLGLAAYSTRDLWPRAEARAAA